MDERKKQQQQEKLILKVLGNIREQQFASMNMEDMAKLMGISRATLYKYFANKEDIFEHFTNGLIQYIEANQLNDVTEETLMTYFQLVFEQSTSLALLVPDSFLQQLKDMYPEMHSRLARATEERNKQTIAFYRFGMEKGFFRQLNPHLLVQQQQLFETLFNVKFLIQNQYTVEQALWDFYYLQKEQLIFERYQELLNDKVMKPKMVYLANKVANLIF
ncbi:TetR/AcrR family transcriptional regulator (plasmid) [Niallia taxi]|uniref:TetR/AcrR family transcriptional regulator n=1 Tax=Niallia taxi TaxID=2499688 RepID=UPI0029350A4B|nr:TetR/AcrR family transcriptional regulator [Niallia taxi]WOD65283.1 TetR/AcrR family transcriptional regulator [Niallia taxi]